MKRTIGKVSGVQDSPSKKPSLEYTDEQYQTDLKKYESLWDLFREEVGKAVKRELAECPQRSYPVTHSVCTDIKESFFKGENFSQEASCVDALKESPQRDYYVKSNSNLSTALITQFEVYTKNEKFIKEFEKTHKEKLAQQEKALKEKQAALELKKKGEEEREGKDLQALLVSMQASLKLSQESQLEIKNKMQEVLKQNQEVLQQNAKLTQQVEVVVQENEGLKNEIVRLSKLNTPMSGTPKNQQTMAFTSEQERMAIAVFRSREAANAFQSSAKESVRKKDMNPLWDKLVIFINTRKAERRLECVKNIIACFSKEDKYFPPIEDATMASVLKKLQETYLLQKENQYKQTL